MTIPLNKGLMSLGMWPDKRMRFPVAFDKIVSKSSLTSPKLSSRKRRHGPCPVNDVSRVFGHPRGGCGSKIDPRKLGLDRCSENQCA